MKRLSCLLILWVLVFSCIIPSVCTIAEDSPKVADAYRNWYEVFVYSYADSDGDGIGDLPGLTEKLDYISDLGCDGIWLMPIMPSPSYHKYDVTDYLAIDPQYGTMADFRILLNEAHARGIRVIIDLPINHSSNLHPWFLSAVESVESPYHAYYNWSDHPQTGYSEQNGLWYESRFVDTMPDLNLDNEQVRAEICSILEFWLRDIGVDGFRLDAVTSYYTGRVSSNVEFLNWLADTAHSLSPDCFLVGEAWENLGLLAQYAESRVDSFFTFPVSQNSGYIAKVLSRKAKTPGQSFAEYVALLEETLPPSSIPAPFTENHDTGRTVGFTGRSDPAKTKMAGGLLCMLRGGIFLYYGQEIGMVGSGDDPNKRIGMLWTIEEETTSPPPGTTTLEYAYPSVSEQEKDAASLLQYYKSALALRNRFPEIARGSSTVLPCDTPDICLITRSWNESSILLAINPSLNPVEYTLSGDAAAYTVLAGSLIAGEEAVSISGDSLTLPSYTVAVLVKP